MFFAFRWLLIWFKRELSIDDCMQLWEVLWTGLPCRNFHLLVCLAIFDEHKDYIMYGESVRFHRNFKGQTKNRTEVEIPSLSVRPLRQV